MDYRIIVEFVLVLVTILSCYLCVKPPRTPAKRALALVVFCTGLWMVSLRVLAWPLSRIFGLFPPPFWVIPTIHSLGWLVGGVWLWFVATYPVPRRWMRWAVIGLILLTVGASWTSWWWLGIPLITSETPYAEQDWHFPVMICWVLLCTCGSLIYLFIQAMHVRGLARLHARHIAVGATLLVMGLAFDLFMRNSYLHTPHPFIGLFLLIGSAFTLVYASSVVRLWAVKHHVRTVILCTVPLMLFFLLNHYYAIPLKDLLADSLFYGDSGLGALFARTLFGLSFLPLCIFARLLTDHMLFTPPYNARKVLEQFGHALAANRTRVDVAQTVADQVNSLFHPVLQSVFVREADDMCRRVFHGGAETSPAALPMHHPLVSAVCLQKAMLVTEELLARRADDQLGNALADLGIHLLIPLHIAGHFRGMLCLGEKHSGDAYTREDIRLLGAMGHEVALALDNASHYEALLQLNQELETRVTERTEQLCEADKAKDRFLAIVSHELLTPLTSILAWVETGLTVHTEECMARSLKIIGESGDKQKHLVHELLDASRLIYGKMGLDLRRDDLWQVCTLAIEGFQPQLQAAQLTLVTSPPTDALPVLADTKRLHQVMGNLLSNAIKFSKAGTTIRVSAWQTATHCHLSVQDEGKGIAAEEIERIFQLFQQGQQQGYTRGLGLGLALVKGILSLHGGDITASSPGIGQGSTFTVTLPLASAPVVAGEVAELVEA